LVPTIFETQRLWVNRLVESVPNFEEFPKVFLSEEEQEFILWLNSSGTTGKQLLFSASDVALKIKVLWSFLLPHISVDSLSKHLVRTTPHSSTRSYANREYLVGKRTFGLWLFRKGLLRGYPLPAKQAKLQYFYAYPREVYSLLSESNFRASFPPHDYFSDLVFAELWRKVGQDTLHKASSEKRRIPHWDESGVYVTDNCYRVPVLGRDYHVWFEVHTGSERYDEQFFLKRLVTMEQFLSSRKHGQYIVLVPFPRDVTTALTAIKKYNAKVGRQGEDHLMIRLSHSRIVHFGQLDGLKESLGLYQHEHWK